MSKDKHNEIQRIPPFYITAPNGKRFTKEEIKRFKKALKELEGQKNWKDRFLGWWKK